MSRHLFWSHIRYFFSRCVTSCYVMSRRVVSSLLVSGLVRLLASCRSSLLVSCHVALSPPVVSFLPMSRHVLLFCVVSCRIVASSVLVSRLARLVASCHVFSSRVMSRRVVSRRVVSDQSPSPDPDGRAEVGPRVNPMNTILSFMWPPIFYLANCTWCKEIASSRLSGWTPVLFFKVNALPAPLP